MDSEKALNLQQLKNVLRDQHQVISSYKLAKYNRLETGLVKNFDLSAQKHQSYQALLRQELCKLNLVNSSTNISTGYFVSSDHNKQSVPAIIEGCLNYELQLMTSCRKVIDNIQCDVKLRSTLNNYLLFIGASIKNLDIQSELN